MLERLHVGDLIVARTSSNPRFVVLFYDGNGRAVVRGGFGKIGHVWQIGSARSKLRCAHYSATDGSMWRVDL